MGGYDQLKMAGLFCRKWQGYIAENGRVVLPNGRVMQLKMSAYGLP